MGNKAFQKLIVSLSRSRFFTISVALHFLLVLTLGTVVLVKKITPREDFDSSGGSLVAPPPTAPEEQLQPLQPSSPDTTAASNTQPAALSASALAVSSGLSPSFTLPTAPATSVPVLAKSITPTTGGPSLANQPRIGNIPTAIAQNIARSVGSWRTKSDSGSGVGKDRAFKFTAYIAKYSGGDWSATINLRKEAGKDVVHTGSLPNLLYFIRKSSRDRIDADLEPVPLDIGSDELLAKRPPFIFFSGHQDFVLNPREIDNLQKYLQLGGAVWGDSSLPGNRSRFDIAFRREMKRVLPDEDVLWTALPPDHPVYTKTYFADIRGVPPGLNYFQEPVYALKRFDEVAVIYTANDYGDMWQIGLDERGQYDLRRDADNRLTAVNETIYDQRDIYFRNLEPKPLFDSYKFGTNIVLHLLTRWDDKMRNVPLGL